jgi:hypothetical protein
MEAKVDKAGREAVRETGMGLSVLITSADGCTATKHLSQNIFSCSSLVVQAKAGRLIFSSADIEVCSYTRQFFSRYLPQDTQSLPR